MQAVVFLHAGSGSSAMWKHQLPAFADAGFRCIAYDRRASQAGADELAQVLDGHQVDRVHLVGTAAGAIVAFDFALSFPRRVLKLVAANTHGGVQDEDYLALQRRLRPAPQFDALPHEVRELGPSYRAADPAGTQEWLALAHASMPSGALPKLQTRARITFAALEALSAPTLLLTGDADLYAPAPVVKLFTDRIKNSRSVVIPACGHSAYWEQPALFNRAVLDFLGNRGQAPI